MNKFHHGHDGDDDGMSGSCTGDVVLFGIVVVL
jgi:hypothetical protein